MRTRSWLAPWPIRPCSLARGPVLLALGLLCGSGLPASGETVELLGQNGRTGGFDFRGDGLPGGDGESVVAEALAPEASNTAIAIAGNGGSGLTGRDGRPASPRGKNAGAGGDAGDATARAVATATRLARGLATAIAEGGSAGGAGNPGVGTPNGIPAIDGRPGSATASASATSIIGDIIASASAEGGAGRDFGAGDATVLRVEGSSTLGGNVQLDAQATGGFLRQPRFGQAAAAGSARIENALRGSTTESTFFPAGTLTGTQRARGGEAELGNFQGRNPDTLGGDATSILSGDFPSAATELTVEAFGGDGPMGGVANASADASNSTGPVTLRVLSRSGDTDRSDAPTTTAFAQAATNRDGDTVRVGDPSAPNSGALGSSPDISARGGDAISTSIGIARGNSEVFVHDRAWGGDGGTRSGDGGAAESSAEGSNAGDAAVQVVAEARGGSSGFAASDGVIGTPGAVTATATGSSSGGGDVHVSALITGGEGGALGGRGGDVAGEADGVSGSTAGTLTLRQVVTGGNGGGGQNIGMRPAGDGGDALARIAGANAAGGRLIVESVAQGGRGGRRDPIMPGLTGVRGTANAFASGVGSGGVDVHAVATPGEGALLPGTRMRFQGLQARARGDVALPLEALAMAQLRPGALPSGMGDADVFASVLALSDRAAVGAAIASDPRARELFSLANPPEGAALIGLGARAPAGSGGESILLTSEVSLEIQLSGLPVADSWTVAFLDSDVGTAAFDALRFAIELEGGVVLDRSFSDAASALQFFEDGLFELDLAGTLVLGNLDLRFLLELEGSAPGAGFGLELFVTNGAPVPEPSTLVLTLFGLAMLRARGVAARRAG
ncbi:MAG: hypothetical protein AAF430_07875 [Myxococcota bacterium]